MEWTKSVAEFLEVKDAVNRVNNKKFNNIDEKGRAVFEEIKKESPSKAYSILAVGAAEICVDKGLLALQSFGNSITNLYESSGAKQLRNTLSEGYSAAQHYNGTSKDYIKKPIEEIRKDL